MPYEHLEKVRLSLSVFHRWPSSVVGTLLICLHVYNALKGTITQSLKGRKLRFRKLLGHTNGE